MTTALHRGVVPEWTLADRLRKAREWAGVTQPELAEGIDVSARSVSNYEAGRREPRRPVLLAWANACGVDVHWLATGEAPPSGDGGASVVRPKGFEPLTF